MLPNLSYKLPFLRSNDMSSKDSKYEYRSLITQFDSHTDYTEIIEENPASPP
jgi:hypothetical protein